MNIEKIFKTNPNQIEIEVLKNFFLNVLIKKIIF